MAKKSLILNDTETVKWNNYGKRLCLFVKLDDYPESPRAWDNLCVLAMFHRRYSLGDDIGKVEPEEYWRNLVRKYVDEKEVFDAAIQGKLPGIRIEKTGDDEYDIYETYYIRSVFGKSEASESLEYQGIGKTSASYYVMDDLTIQHCMVLLEPYAEWKPIWMYEHGGITISCGSRAYPYNDAWDSGCVGWAIAFKDDIMRETCGYVLDENGERIKEEYKHENGPSTWGYKTEPLTDDNWRERAEEIIDGEVNVYDQYLRGDVYCYTLYEEQPAEEGEEPDWEEIDSCCGFYGDDVLESGMADQAGNGLTEAIESGEYETGTARKHTVVSWEF